MNSLAVRAPFCESPSQEPQRVNNKKSDGEKMIRIAVVDDENRICAQLESMLLTIAKENNLRFDVDVLYSGSALCEELKRGTIYDVIYRDIEMEDVSGIEASRFIRETFQNDSVEIVYVSGKTQYAMELFQFSPMDFIVKPIQRARVNETVQKFLRISGSEETFKYKKERETIRVKYKDILYLESDGRKIVITTTDRQDSFHGVMKEIEDGLKDAGFICLHRGCIVNYRHIKSFGYKEVTMSDGKTLTISKDRREEVQTIQMQMEGGDVFND